MCRKHDLSQGTFYKLKSKYGGMEVSDVAKMRSLEDENHAASRISIAPLSLNTAKKLIHESVEFGRG